jgi:ABC-type multidrug transport system fused ATPase/permease subunit
MTDRQICDSHERANFGLIAKLGRRYLLPQKAFLVFYVAAYLLGHSLLPAGIGVLAKEISNQISHARPAETEMAINPAARTTNASSNESARSLPGADTIPVWFVYILWVLGTLAAVGVALASNYFAAKLSGKVSNAIRRDVFAALLRKSSHYFHEHEPQQLTVVVNELSKQMQSALQQILIDPVLDFVGMVVLGYTLFTTLAGLASGNGTQVWWLFGAIVLIALCSPWLVSRMGRKLQRNARGVQQQSMLISSLVGGAVHAPEEIQAMDAEDFFDQKHRLALDQMLRSQLDQTMTVGTLNLLNRFPGDFVLIALMGLAVLIATTGVAGINGGIVAGLLALTPAFMGSIQGFSALVIHLRMSWPAVETIAAVLQPEGGATAEQSKHEHAHTDDSIEARNLVFSYRPGESRRVLDNVSFVLPAGKITGLVAKAGQGKTTFFRLALRFYEPTSGEILIGGKPNTEFSLQDLRQQVVLMHQSPAFFHDTIRENMRMAKRDATDSDIRELCQKTALWPILLESYGPKPLDCQFAAGAALSGGQKKLFALTRCLLRNPSILLLDEPTTGIDPDDKFDLLRLMREACLDRTVVVVDHDVVGWQIPFCDQFIVLDHGKICQTGTAAELLSVRGLFKDLFDKQTEGVRRMSEELRRAEQIIGEPFQEMLQTESVANSYSSAET